MKQLLLLVLVSCSAGAAQTGYRLIHPDGTVEFSDQPLPAGEAIELREAPTIWFAPPSPPPVTTPQGKKRDALEADRQGKISITAPRADETLWFDESGVTASVVVTPPLQDGQKIVIRVDGREVASGTGSSFRLGVLYRGTHTLSAAIVTAAGALVASAPSVTFHVRQPSVLNRTAPPAPPPAEEPPPAE
ncbi:MAG: hypothetical protein OQL08_00680 [Gammaproteobacteria bacterium]|nr:hypothetical protein [Gammaproteobacteria bacterium]